VVFGEPFEYWTVTLGSRYLTNFNYG